MVRKDTLNLYKVKAVACSMGRIAFGPGVPLGDSQKYGVRVGDRN
jgi:hypothetical protein